MFAVDTCLTPFFKTVQSSHDFFEMMANIKKNTVNDIFNEKIVGIYLIKL